MRRVKKGKSWAIRKHVGNNKFEYLGSDDIWGAREKRREFKVLKEALGRSLAFVLVGVRARVVPYGEKGE